MRKRVVLAALCIFAFPLMFSPSQNDKPKNSVPFAAVALAGRTTYGGYCQCGCPACICDEGERPGACLEIAGPGPEESGNSINPAAAPVQEPEALDFGSAAMMAALAFFAWARFRGTSL